MRSQRVQIILLVTVLLLSTNLFAQEKVNPKCQSLASG